MRLFLKPLLHALLGSLLLLQPPAGGGEEAAARQAERALIHWLGGPIALCLPGARDGPDPGAAAECHPCCLAASARGPAVPPEPPRLPLPRATAAAASWEPPPRPPAPRSAHGPQQPRAPPVPVT